MYTQFNEQFAAATRQFADTASQASRLMLENTEALFGLQMAAVEDRANATFAFFGEAAEARDFDAAKALWPKGVQIARENVERAVTAGQEAFGRTLKTNEAIAELAKGQFESAAKNAQANVEKAAKAATKAAK